jgi:hypothetical protein
MIPRPQVEIEMNGIKKRIQEIEAGGSMSRRSYANLKLQLQGS